MAVTNSVINIPVRPVGTNFEVRGPKVSTDCDVLRRNPPGLRVVVGQNYVPKLFTPYCKLLCYCFKYCIKRNLF